MSNSDVKKVDKKIVVTVSNSFFSNEAILAACYKFTDEQYVFIQASACTPTNVDIIVERKDGCEISEAIIKRFCNELIDQQVRYNTNQQFGHIRDLIVEEAFKPIS